MLLIYSNGVHNHFLKLIGNCCFWWEAPIKFTDCTFVHQRNASYQLKSNILSHGIICLSLLGLKIDLYCFYRWIGLASPCPSSLTYAVFQRNAFQPFFLMHCANAICQIDPCTLDIQNGTIAEKTYQRR